MFLRHLDSPKTSCQPFAVSNTILSKGNRMKHAVIPTEVIKNRIFLSEGTWNRIYICLPPQNF